MKKNDVKIGANYMAKVTNSVVPVRIDTEKPNGGWDGKNLATGRKIHIKSAQRLRRKCTEADMAGLGRSAPNRRSRKSSAAVTLPAVATVTKPAKKGSTGTKTHKVATRPKQGELKAKKPSGLDAAARVLVEVGKPLSVKEIVATAFEKGYWKSDGQTPQATIYSAIIREISTRGDEARFKKVARGRFTVRSAK